MQVINKKLKKHYVNIVIYTDFSNLQVLHMLEYTWVSRL